jgi:hypothetical protein
MEDFAQWWVASRMGSLRTIAAVHHQINQAVATPLTLHMQCKNVVACGSSEINFLPVLGVRGAPNLDAIPDSSRLSFFASVFRTAGS